MRDRLGKLRRAHGVEAPRQDGMSGRQGGPEGPRPSGPDRGDAAAPRPTGRTTLETLRALRRAMVESPRPEVALPAEGREVANARGSFWLRTLRYPADRVHGRTTLGDALAAVEPARVAEQARDPAFASLDPGEFLFLDTETTGLSGGAGTVVFLTGVAFVDGAEPGERAGGRPGGLVLEQAFLRSFEDEPAALQHVADRLAEHPLPVTFVGKSFDRHRLAARMVLHGIDTGAVLAARHLDLYHVARRAWKDELPDVRLRTVEERRLGVFRHDDLPGREAPAAWLRWMQDRTGPVDRVMEHNRVDVLTLVALLGRLCGGSRGGGG